MDAILSAQAGMAFLIKEDKTFALLHADDPDTPLPSREYDFPVHFGDKSDLQFIEDSNFETIKQEFILTRDTEDALHLCLAVLDPQFDDEKRRASARILGALLENRQVELNLQFVLFSHPLPVATDIGQNLNKIRNGKDFTYFFIKYLVEYQPEIIHVHKAWTSIPMDLFGSKDAYQQIRLTLVREGVFRNLVYCVKKHLFMGSYMEQIRCSPKFSCFEHWDSILKTWFGSLRDFDGVNVVEKARFLSIQI